MAKSSNEETAETLVGCGVMIACLLFSPFIYAWWGFCASHLWNWFAVPFFGASVLSVAMAVGLGTLLGLLKHKTPKRSTKEMEEDVKDVLFATAYGLFSPTMALVIGYIATLFL